MFPGGVSTQPIAQGNPEEMSNRPDQDGPSSLGRLFAASSFAASSFAADSFAADLRDGVDGLQSCYMSTEEELGASHRYELQNRYLELTRIELPAEARRRGWEVSEDHCFMRIILDRLFGDCWYNHLDRRLTAYKQLGDQQLRECIAMGERLLEGDTVALTSWNEDSLRWRAKLQ